MTDAEYGEAIYRAYATEGWDTEEALREEADPAEIELAHRWATTTEGVQWPPSPLPRDFRGQVIAAAFHL